MRVNLTIEQAENVLENLQGNHLCDSCEYDEQGLVIKGTECLTQKMINKFQRLVDGSASKQGRRGGFASMWKRRIQLSDAKSEGIKLMGETMILDERTKSILCVEDEKK